MTNPTATERARVARASGRSGFRRSININRALAPIDLLLDLLAFLLSPLGWALKEMRERIGALLARKLAAQLRRTLAHAGIPIPALSDVDLIFWVSRTKPFAKGPACRPEVAPVRATLDPSAEFGNRTAACPNGWALGSSSRPPQNDKRKSADPVRARGPPGLTRYPNSLTALGQPKRGRNCWRNRSQ
jgi:hypothetical protein